MGMIFALVIIGTAIWVFFDAQKLTQEQKLAVGPGGQSPIIWAVATALLWLIVFPYYLYRRDKPTAKDAGTGTHRNPLVFLLAAVLIVIGLGAGATAMAATAKATPAVICLVSLVVGVWLLRR